MIIIVMGVTGTGKTTIGKRVAESLGWEFSDADSFHPQANIEKMQGGFALDDADRMPWLMSLQQAIDGWLQEDKNIVLACSALKAAYRQILCRDPERMQIVYLQGSFELIAERLSKRENHFMNKDLLKSQFDALEEPNPDESIWVEILPPPDAIAQEIISRLKMLYPESFL
jgi:gluconokinase